jgi:hypothetical protein
MAACARATKAWPGSVREEKTGFRCFEAAQFISSATTAENVGAGATKRMLQPMLAQSVSRLMVSFNETTTVV